jgi:hypothetical protein
MARHLSSEELEEVMAGRGAEGTMRHARDCEMCATELVQVRRLLGEFRESAEQTADRQRLLAVMPRPRAGSAWLRGGVWAGVLAVVLAAASLMFVWGPTPIRLPHLAQRGSTHAMPQARAETPELSDEALLNGVQNDLSSTVPAPLEPLATTTTPITNINAGNTKE